MVDIALVGSRPKLDQTNILNITVQDLATADTGSNGIDLPLVLDNITLDTVNITADATSGSAILAGTGFTGLKVGSVVAGASIPVGAVILSVDSDTQITLDQNAVATVVGEAMTVDGAADLTVAVLRLTFALGGNTLQIAPSISLLNGSAITDITGGTDNLGYSNGSVVSLGNRTINIDGFLTSAGVDRTNS